MQFVKAMSESFSKESGFHCFGQAVGKLGPCVHPPEVDPFTEYLFN